MTDIVERLRLYANGATRQRYPDSLMKEAADEIERLRKELTYRLNEKWDRELRTGISDVERPDPRSR